MLQRFAEKFQNIVLIGLVLLISAVFILQFGGPQAEGCSAGEPLYAAKVYGTTISQGDFRAAYLLASETRLYGFQGMDPNGLKRQVLDALIERELMAREARDLGFDLNEDQALQTLAQNCIMLVTTSSASSPGFTQHEVPIACKDRKGKFSVKNVVNFVEYRLRRSLKEFSEGQVQEGLAQRLSQTLMSSVSASPSEAWDAYAREKERAKLKYIRYSPVYYRGVIKPSDQDVRAWLSQNTKKVDAKYQEEKHRYTNLEPQVQARHILIKMAADADQATKESAFKKAEQLLNRARKGEDFATLARAHSEDVGSARSGGDLGYNPRGRMVKAFDDAQFALKPGQLSDIVESEFGFHIIKVEGRREGTVPAEQAKLEIAKDLYLEEAADKAAHSAAEQALAQLRVTQQFDVVVKASPSDAGTDPLAPTVQETQSFGRTDTPIPGPFNNQPLLDAAFTKLSLAKPLPDKPLKLGSEWIVFKLESREHAVAEAFTPEEQRRMLEQLNRDAQKAALAAYVNDLRKQAEASNSLRINDKIFTERAAGNDTDDSDS